MNFRYASGSAPVIDGPLRIRADHERRHAQPVTLRIDRRRLHVIVEAAPVVPGEEDRGRLQSRLRMIALITPVTYLAAPDRRGG